MRKVALALLFLCVGCLGAPTSTPASTSSSSTPPAKDAVTLVPLYRLDRNDTGNSTAIEERFEVPHGHWLCVEWTFDRYGGSANLTVIDARGEQRTIYDTLQRPNATGDDMIGSVAGNWTVRLTLASWSGRTRVSVENEV